MNIVLIGYRGTGKSCVSHLLGRQLGWKIVSTDAEIIKHTRLSVPEIVERFGWEHFRSQETAICQELSCKDRLIIDSGGGAILREENVAHLRTNGLLFWLTADVKTIAARIGGDTQRPPLTEGKSFIEEIAEVLQERLPKYQRAADHTIATDALTPKQIADQILGQLPPEVQGK